MKLHGRVCIIGNGPSAKDTQEIVDACDWVIRMNHYTRVGALGTGDRIDIHSTYMLPAGQHKRADDIQFAWFVIPPGVQESVPDGRKTSPLRWREIRECYGAAKCTRIARAGYDTLMERTKSSPSTGIATVHMALQRGADALVILGFDSTFKGRYGDSDARGKWNDRTWKSHNAIQEKLLLVDLCAGKWLGRSINIPVEWQADERTIASIDRHLGKKAPPMRLHKAGLFKRQGSGKHPLRAKRNTRKPRVSRSLKKTRGCRR